MKAKALKTFFHDQLGRVEEGTEFEATDAQLSGVRRFVEVYSTKVVREVPDDSYDTAGNQDAPTPRRKRNGRGRAAHKSE